MVVRIVSTPNCPFDPFGALRTSQGPHIKRPDCLPPRIQARSLMDSVKYRQRACIHLKTTTAAVSAVLLRSSCICATAGRRTRSDGRGADCGLGLRRQAGFMLHVAARCAYRGDTHCEAWFALPDNMGRNVGRNPFRTADGSVTAALHVSWLGEANWLLLTPDGEPVHLCKVLEEAAATERYEPEHNPRALAIRSKRAHQLLLSHAARADASSVRRQFSSVVSFFLASIAVHARLEIRWQPHVARCPWRAMGVP